MMRLNRFALIVTTLTLGLGFGLVGGEAHGQSTGTVTDTTTPAATAIPTLTPTATATLAPSATSTPSIPSGPSGSVLVKKMQKAFVTKNSYRVSTHGKFAIGSTPMFIWTIQKDISLKPQLAVWVETDQSRATTQQVGLKTVHVRQVIVGDQEAAKEDKLAWRCFPASHITTGATGLQGAKMTNPPVNLGSERVGTIQVWHVRQVGTFKSNGNTDPVFMDYFISKSNFTLVRSTLSAALLSSGVVTDLTSDDVFTKYGENVHAKLPAGCGGKMTSVAARGIGLPGSFGSLSAR
jgi:hypothetical protein